MQAPAPRLYGIAATCAPVVAVLRRGPSAWCHVGRWDVEQGTYEGGAWLHGRLYPQRCDVSPDGRWLLYFAHDASASWGLGWTYVAISRLPWLYALAAWGTAGTWSRGAHFVDDPSVRLAEEPGHGSVPYEQLGAGLAVTRPAAFAVERRRGWSETEGSPPCMPDDVWDERRADSLRMTKRQPGSAGRVLLEVSGGYAAFRSRVFSSNVGYRVVEDGGTRDLADVQWADWAHDGRLLVATHEGRLEVRGGRDWLTADATVADLAQDGPAPVKAPDEARRWS